MTVAAVTWRSIESFVSTVYMYARCFLSVHPL